MSDYLVNTEIDVMVSDHPSAVGQYLQRQKHENLGQ